MDFNGVLGVVGLLLYWRALLCLLCSGLLAFLLVQAFPWFTGLQGIFLAALGLFPGVVWEELARPSPGRPKVATSTVVAVLAALLFGGSWGAASSTSLHSALAGAVINACTAWGWLHYAVRYQGWLSRQQGLTCAIVALVAYPAVALLAHNAF